MSQQQQSSTVATSFVVVEDAPVVALFDIWLYRAGHEPQIATRRPTTLAHARELAGLLNADPYLIRPARYELVPAGERPASMPELLAQLHELEDYVADLQAQIARMLEER
ncbi:MAG: hypothetical protein A2V88_05040 [Elusimicrobia bacterium RBG_16_66_12]|nr:MAG: hypothetical protein A2V88_05040 [Elusimicrobia bacterium RBG_16_66_12]